MKKISILFLSAAMAFALTACGDAPTVTSVNDNQVETVTPDIEPTVTEVVETSETIETTKEDETIVEDATNEDEVESNIAVDETTTTDTIEDEVVEAPIETTSEEATPVESTISNETSDPIETQPQTQKAVRVTRTYFNGTSWTTASYYNSYDSIDEALLSIAGLTFNDIKSTWSYQDDRAVWGDGVLNYYYNGEYMVPIRNDRPNSYNTSTETFIFYYN